MKRIKLLGIAVALTCTFLLAGCADRDDDMDELEKKVDQLEQDVDNLKNKDSSTGSGTTSTDSQNTQTTDPSAETLEDLSAAVDEVTAKADEATVPESSEERNSQFLELKDALNTVDARLDAYDDYLESQYKQGSMSYSDYRNASKDLDPLEDKLDQAEDKLELTFGIDD